MPDLRAVPLNTLFGRLVAALRQETGRSQAAFARKLAWDRSLLSRIESGRNTATVENLFALERAFRDEDVLADAGDLAELLDRAARRARRREIVVLYGQDPPADAVPVPLARLDCIVGAVLERYMAEIAPEPDEGEE